MPRPLLLQVSLRIFRVGLLVAAVCLIREHEARHGSLRREPLSVERVRDFFPKAASLDAEPGTSSLLAVRDSAGAVLGFVTETSPASDKIIGYSGPTNSLLAFDAAGALMGTRVLRSGDTPDHLAEVISERPFFAQFRGLKMGGHAPEVQAVSGATLTSLAIAEAVLARLGQQGRSLRFPEEVTLEEARAMEPRAREIRPAPRLPGAVEVLDGAGHRVALVIRTSPASDTIVGYKGPSDWLVLLDPPGETIRAIRLRKSFDTKTYVGYVTEDAHFMKLLAGRDVREVAALDYAKEGVEGVSGATETSWAMAEGLKRRAQSLLAEKKAAAPFWERIRWRWQDTGHVVIILSALAMAFTPLRGNSLARTMHHVLLVLYAGLAAGELLSQALFAGWARHGTPWASAPGLVLLAVVALAGPVVTRRQLYCHHICPHGALQQLLARQARWQWVPSKKTARWLERVPFLLLALVFVVAVMGIPVDLNNLEPFDAWLPRIAGPAAIAIAVIGLAWSVFTPMAYCKHGCPTGALFKLLRFSGDAERFSARDGIALALVVLAAASLLA